MTTCPFCHLTQEKRLILFESPHCLVILSNPRLMPGHILVLPRRHVERLGELGAEERTELLEVVVQFQEKLLALGAPGCDIRQHYRPFLPDDGLKVGHLHIHLQPRSPHDQLFQESQSGEVSLFLPLSKGELEEWKGKLT